MPVQKGGNLGLDSLRQQGSCALPQNITQRIVNFSWPSEANNSIVFHGVSLLLGDVARLSTATIRRLLFRAFNKIRG